MSQPVSREAAPPSTHQAEAAQADHSSGSFWILALGSIGVVFGDIGTSPLYALQTALGQLKDAAGWGQGTSSASSPSSSGPS